MHLLSNYYLVAKLARKCSLSFVKFSSWLRVVKTLLLGCGCFELLCTCITHMSMLFNVWEKFVNLSLFYNTHGEVEKSFNSGSVVGGT